MGLSCVDKQTSSQEANSLLEINTGGSKTLQMMLLIYVGIAEFGLGEGEREIDSCLNMIRPLFALLIDLRYH